MHGWCTHTHAGIYARALAKSPGGGQPCYAGGTSRNSVLMCKISEGKARAAVLVQGHTGSISGLAVDPTTHSFATAGEDGNLRLWCA